jgi:hypothetical protein
MHSSATSQRSQRATAARAEWPLVGKPKGGRAIGRHRASVPAAVCGVPVPYIASSGNGGRKHKRWSVALGVSLAVGVLLTASGSSYNFPTTSAALIGKRIPGTRLDWNPITGGK